MTLNQISVFVENNPGIAGIALKFNYNREVLKLKEIIYPVWDATDNLGQDSDKNYISIVYSRASNFTKNGTIATLVFEIAQDAAPGTYPIEILATEATNADLDDVLLTEVDGSVTVYQSIVGDTNCDGVINSKDIVLLAQYLAGWGVTIDLNAADCNGDGTIDTRDAVLLSQYLADWDVELSTK